MTPPPPPTTYQQEHPFSCKKQQNQKINFQDKFSNCFSVHNISYTKIGFYTYLITRAVLRVKGFAWYYATHIFLHLLHQSFHTNRISAFKPGENSDTWYHFYTNFHFQLILIRQRSSTVHLISLSTLIPAVQQQHGLNQQPLMTLELSKWHPEAMLLDSSSISAPRPFPTYLLMRVVMKQRVPSKWL